MWIMQRELDDGIGNVLISTIAVNVVNANLTFEGLKAAFFDLFTVSVDCVARDAAETCGLTDISKFFGEFQDFQFFLYVQIDH